MLFLVFFKGGRDLSRALVVGEKKNRTEDMPTFPCLGGNKKEKNLTRAGVCATHPETTTEERTRTPTPFVAAAVVEESGVDRSLDRSRESARRRRELFLCVGLNLSPYRRIKSIFFIYRKKKRAAERKKRELKFPNLKKERKTKTIETLN